MLLGDIEMEYWLKMGKAVDKCQVKMQENKKCISWNKGQILGKVLFMKRSSFVQCQLNFHKF